MYSYAVEKPLSVGHKVAGYLPSLFWGFITLGRLISIPVSSRVKPATMVFINVVSGRWPPSLLLAVCSGLDPASREEEEGTTCVPLGASLPVWASRFTSMEAEKAGAPCDTASCR